MVRASFRPAILRYFEQHERQNVYLEDLAEAIGATKEQAQGAMTNLRANMPDMAKQIKVIVTGNVWTYDRDRTPAAKPTKRMFEELATAKDGTIVIQDQDGGLYRASEL